MIIVNPSLVKLNYPGYFWHVLEKKLYSIKSGELRELKRHRSITVWVHQRPMNLPNHYQISVNGRRKILAYEDLLRITEKDALQLQLL